MSLRIDTCSQCGRTAIRKYGRYVGPRGGVKFFCPDPVCQAAADVIAAANVARTPLVKAIIQKCVAEQLASRGPLGPATGSNGAA
jgi:transposase